MGGLISQHRKDETNPEETYRPTRSEKRRSQDGNRNSIGSNNSPQSLADELVLNGKQKALIRNSWSRIHKTGPGHIGEVILREALGKAPGLKECFQHVQVIEGVFNFGLSPMPVFHPHAKLILTLLEDAIKNMDNLASIRQRCYDIGATHSPYHAYGLKSDYWDIFGESIIESALTLDRARSLPDRTKAWTVLASFLIDNIRHGYEDSVRRRASAQAYQLPVANPNTSPPKHRASIACKAELEPDRIRRNSFMKLIKKDSRELRRASYCAPSFHAKSNTDKNRHFRGRQSPASRMSDFSELSTSLEDHSTVADELSSTDNARN